MQHEAEGAKRTPKHKIKPPESPVSELSVTHNEDAGLQRGTDRNELEGIPITYDRD